LEVFAFNPKFPRKRKILISGTWNNFYDWELTRRLVAFFNETGFVVSWCRPRESKTHQLFLPNVQIIETEYANMPQFIADSSFGIAICRDDVGVSLSAAVPTKIAEFLSVGRPVILSSGMGDLDKLISETNTGIILDRRTSLEGLLSSMNFLLQDKETPMRCRSLALRHFDLSEAARKYSALYKKIASTTS
jgi:glycosyltransferase involved in cell wall biosynthesis